MSLSVKNIEILKAWYIRAGKSKDEMSDDLTDETISTACDALSHALGEGHYISIESLINAIDSDDEHYQSQLNILHEYLRYVLQPVNNAITYVPLNNDAFLEKMRQQFAIPALQMNDNNAPVQKVLEHSSQAVDLVLQKYSPGMSTLTFPEGFTKQELAVSDYAALYNKLASLTAIGEPLSHLYLTPLCDAALLALTEHYSQGGNFRVKHLYFSLSDHNSIRTVLSALDAIPQENIGEIILQDHDQLPEDCWIELVRGVIAEKIAVNITLPKPYVNSQLQADLDAHSSNLLRAERINQLNSAQIKQEKIIEMGGNKRKRIRTKARVVNKEIELQQQQQVQFKRQHIRSNATENTDDLQLVSFEKLQTLIITGELSLDLEKCFLTELELRKAWNNWFGHIATYQTREGKLVCAEDANAGAELFNVYLNNQFEYITEEACLMLLSHQPQLLYGFDFQRLPSGFHLVKHPYTDGKVLHFSEALASDNEYDNLVVKLKDTKQDYKISHDVVEQLLNAYKHNNHPSYVIIKKLLDNIKNAAHYEGSHLNLIHKLLPKLFQYDPNDLKVILSLIAQNGSIDIEKLSALINLHNSDYSDLAGKDEHLQKVLKRVIDNVSHQAIFFKIKRLPVEAADHAIMLVVEQPFDKEFKAWIKSHKIPLTALDGLYAVYVDYGVDGLKKIMKLSADYRKAFDIVKLILQSERSSTQLISDQRALQSLSDIDGNNIFTAIEKQWLFMLIEQHASAVKDFHITDLVNAFSTFIRIIRDYNLECYAPVAFTDVKNMQVALGRMLTILEKTNVSERQTQWQCITSLPLGPDGAIKAVQDNTPGNMTCHIVLPVMQTIPVAYAAEKSTQFCEVKSQGPVRNEYHGYMATSGFDDIAISEKSKNKNANHYIDVASHSINREFIDREFYRVISHLPYRRPLDEYPDLIEIIHKARFQPEITVYVYKLLVETSTGRANSLTNDKLNREEYRAAFKKLIDELNSIRLSYTLAAAAKFASGLAGLYFRTQGTSLMDELGAPHPSYSIDDLVRYLLVGGACDSLINIPPVTYLYYLLFFITQGIRDISLVKMIKGDQMDETAFSLFTGIESLGRAGHTLAFCDGLRFYTAEHIKSFVECRKYLDVVNVIVDVVNVIVAAPKDMRITTNIGRSEFRKILSRAIISIISTFNMRDEVLDILKLDMQKKIYLSSSQAQLLMFGLQILRDLDLSLNTGLFAGKLEPEHFANYFTELVNLVTLDGANEEQIIAIVKDRFGKYYPEGYFDKIEVNHAAHEAHARIAAIFPNENHQKLLLKFFDKYRDPQSVHHYDRFLTSLEHLSRNLTAGDMAILIQQLQALSEISNNTNNEQPSLERYCHLLNVVIDNNAYNSLIYCISTTQNVLRESLEDALLKATISENYLSKVICFIENLGGVYRANPDDVLSQSELMHFTCHFLNNTQAEKLSAEKINYPLINNYRDLIDQVFSEENIIRYCEQPVRFLDYLNNLVNQTPELQFLPEIAALQSHLAEVKKQNEQAREAAEKAKNKHWLDTAREAAEVAGSNVAKTLGGWMQRLRGEQTHANRPEIVLGRSVFADKRVFITLREALIKKHELQKTYPGVLTGLVENMQLLSSQYMATSKEIVKFINHYCDLMQRENYTFDTILSHIYQLRQFLCGLNDEKMVSALCFHFNNENDDKCHSPHELLNLISHPYFTGHTLEHQSILLDLLIKLLNNNSIDDIYQYRQLLGLLLEKNNDSLFDMIKQIYANAPYVPLDTLFQWIESENPLSELYCNFEKAPCRRECGENEPNGFKLDVAIKQSRLITGVNITEAEMQSLHQETVRVRSLSIAQLKDELKNLVFIGDEQLPLLVALTAELLYRAKGSAPSNENTDEKQWGASFEINTTQYLALYSMLKSGEHVTAEVISGEGKTRITMIHLACQFVMGKTVDFVTSDISLAHREFTEFQSYFNLLGAESRMIHAHSPAKHYALRGINISDPASLELFRNRAHSEGLSHLVIDSNKSRRAMILDEGDKTYFDLADTRFNYSSANDEKLRDMEWVYPLLMAYFMERDPVNPSNYRYESNYCDDMDKCIEEFYRYITEIHLPPITPAQHSRLSLISEEKLESWFESALTARDLEYQTAFTVAADIDIMTDQGPKIASAAKLIIENREDDQSKYSFGVHQCLHARLNIIYNNIKHGKSNNYEDQQLVAAMTNCLQPAHIEGEKQIIYSSTTKTMLNDYDEGTLYAVTGTPGSISERKEAEILYAKQHPDEVETPPVPMNFITIPRHNPLKRVDNPIQLAANQKQTIKMVVKEIIRSRLNKQPTLIICANDRECQEIADGVKQYMKNHQLDQGEMFVVDTKIKLRDENVRIHDDIGRANVVTFTTPKLGRGVDIPLHNDGAKVRGLKVLVVGTLMRLRDYLQVVARSGRFGAKGETRIILNKEQVKQQLGKRSLRDGFYTSPQSYLRREQAIIDRKKQVERLINFAYVDFRNKLQSALYHEFQLGLPRVVRTKMRNLWQTCLQALDQKWNAELQEIVMELYKPDIKESEINARLKTMHEFASLQWGAVYRGLQEDTMIRQQYAGHLDKLMKDVPPFTLDASVLKLIQNYSLEEAAPKTLPIYDKYDSAHDGQAAIYTRRFELLRATFAGERRWFADLRAWWKGRGILLANLRAAFRGDISFTHLIFGGKNEPLAVDANRVESSTVMINKKLVGVKGPVDSEVAKVPTPVAVVENVTDNPNLQTPAMDINHEYVAGNLSP